jgi:hypothetical protein
MEAERDPAQSTLCDEEKFKNFSDVDTGNLKPTSQSGRKRTYQLLAVAFVAAIVMLPVIYLTASRRTTAGPKYNQCGTSAEEARARGCVFEATGFTWLPRECYDGETESEFLQYVAENDLKLYHDPDYTNEARPEEVQKGNGAGYFVREGYHLAHCLFLFKKLHRSYVSGKPIDGYITSLNHTAHCVGQSLSVGQDADYHKELIQFSYIKWPYCGKPGGYNLIWEKRGQWTDY